MFDINKIINDTIAAAVSTHITTLQQEYANKMAEMAEKITALETRLLALENNPAQGVDTTLEQRIAALEAAEQPLTTFTMDALLERLDNQEWFWNKLRNFTDSAVEQAIDMHIETYDRVVSALDGADLDDYVQKDSFRDEIEDVLNNATIRICF